MAAKKSRRLSTKTAVLADFLKRAFNILGLGRRQDSIGSYQNTLSHLVINTLAIQSVSLSYLLTMFFLIATYNKSFRVFIFEV